MNKYVSDTIALSMGVEIITNDPVMEQSANVNTIWK